MLSHNATEKYPQPPPAPSFGDLWHTGYFEMVIGRLAIAHPRACNKLALSHGCMGFIRGPSDTSRGPGATGQAELKDISGAELLPPMRLERGDVDETESPPSECHLHTSGDAFS